MKKNMVVAGAVLGSVFVLSGCGDLALDFRDRQQEVVSYDVTGELAVLDAATGSGDIVIVESGRQAVRVTETLHWRGQKPVTEHPVDGGTLTLRENCEGMSCSVDYKVEIPPGLTAKLDTGSGTITLRGLTGEVTAASGSGDIEAGGLNSKRFTADTGSGDIEARFSAAPEGVRLETGNGDVAAYLPKGGYDVTAETGSGDKIVEVTKDPSSPRKVTLRTGSGDAEVLLS
ncbi:MULTISPECIES: DUF4097 family beta strand repeat-containing protein [unclassified Streptosporangium]|uniref:DUF4097 family beta strand repeat-containing protein n=1 Tax=unclassified Streptosporangium TaxID=2632669 RepID=UPI002E2E6D91|nr:MULTISPECIES: DUF4097 family beta strand repeat-containing protein [unclassified Streptosporangium]